MKMTIKEFFVFFLKGKCAVDFLMIQSCGWVIIDGLVYLTKADASLFFFLPGMWHISCVFFHQVVKKRFYDPSSYRR
jgi:hypothetical protein